MVILVFSAIVGATLLSHLSLALTPDGILFSMPHFGFSGFLSFYFDIFGIYDVCGRDVWF